MLGSVLDYWETSINMWIIGKHSGIIGQCWKCSVGNYWEVMGSVGNCWELRGTVWNCWESLDV